MLLIVLLQYVNRFLLVAASPNPSISVDYIEEGSERQVGPPGGHLLTYPG